MMNQDITPNQEPENAADDTSPMTPLDQMVAQDQLQMLKAAIPYAPSALQPSLAIFSKYLELQRTIRLFSRPAELSMMSAEAPQVTPLEMIQDISRFAPATQRDAVSQLLQTLQAFQLFQNFNEEELP